jgi:phospholipid/cholesterol/gamma-HCH transport system substrate-binding protein
VNLSRQIAVKLVIFVVVSLVAATVMAVGYMRVPALLFGVGRYTVTVELPNASGLYKNGNVTYRGVEVGRIGDVRLTGTGAEAVLSLKSDVAIPSDLDAEVHSQSSVGEQYVALLPRDGQSPPLADGDVVPAGRTSVLRDVGSLLDATDRSLQAIPRDNLKTVVDESYTAFGGLGPELNRIVRGSSDLAAQSRNHLDALTTLIDKSPAVLDSQADTADSIQAWASHLATISRQLEANDGAIAGIIQNGGPAASEARQLVEQLRPTLPVLLANLVSVGEVALTYQPNLEQLLVLLPQGVSMLQAVGLADRNVKGPAAGGAYLGLNLQVNIPPPCSTGFLPAQQRRTTSFEDAPDRPAGDIYCRVPQDSTMTGVRGARNLPCETVPGKRAPTVKMCESDEQYVPLNDGYNWKGDPNATLSGQDVPQLSADQRAAAGVPSSAAAPEPPVQVGDVPALASAQYDPSTGTYVGPDLQLRRQSDLARDGVPPTWQDLLTPPKGN